MGRGSVKRALASLLFLLPAAAWAGHELENRDLRNGRTLYVQQCASCHGANAVGQDGVASPLIHVIYEPGHHGDESFQRAVAMGVRAHHWPFGDMSAVKGLTRRDVTKVMAYIRELQRANGID